VVNAVLTFTNIGLRVDFAARWLKAFITGRWPPSCIFCGPVYSARITEVIVRSIDGYISFAAKPAESFAAQDRWYLP
jgi:hypothetical protein